jgi:hypothetical protein
VLRRIFGSKRDEVTGESRKLHNGKLHDLYFSPNIVWVIKSRRMRLAVHVVRMGLREACIGFWWGKTNGRRPMGRSRRRWEDNIKMELQEVGCGSRDWIELSQDRDRWRALVNAAMNHRFP